MVQCQAEKSHWFCKDCFRRHASEVAGKMRYKVPCMSTEDCNAGFSHRERQKGLNSGLMILLDKYEARAAIAGIEDLIHCSFCDFACFSRPHEVVRDLLCPSCGKVSQFASQPNAEGTEPSSGEKDPKRHRQRRIEDARSNAVIRYCTGCQTPFMKLDGCNKMTCPLERCKTVQCYICSSVCDYSHFDTSRDHCQPDKCPLWDNTEARHQRELELAEQTIVQQVEEPKPWWRP
ncbi:hypothetical protein FDECE_11115 [Fusarium decemcellulare]|nr:hypothetical protein FDECE_11115 [Fusarium decemcellulare]